LLTGTAGSGKTHNIIKLISYQVDDDTSEIINDIIPIYISISENSKIDLKKPLSIFIDYNKFKENEEYLNYLSVLFKNKKIVIVLDGIEYYNGDLIEIFKLIVDSSKFNNIYWILSINKNYLDDVIYGDTEHNRFTKKYSVCFDHIEKQKPNNQFLNDNIEIDILFFNEWINIDYLNIKYQVQYEIISKTFDNLILDKEFDIYNYCPQISWIICDIATANNINSLLNLPYHKIFVKLEESFKYIKLSKKNLAIIIEYICEFIIENKTEKISKIVINELTNLLFVNLLHNNHPNDLSKNILNDLLQNNLISISSSNIYKSDINLSTEIYWSYKVSEIFDKNQNQNNLADGNLSKIFLHRVYEFFILNLNNQEDEEDLKNLEALIFGIFNDNLGPKSSIWFTADKLCPRVRYKVERKITEATIYKNHIYDDRHDLYSFMLYLCNYEIIYTKFNYIKKLSVLQNIIYDVKYFNLNQIYFDICKGIVSPINNVEDIFRSVKYFEKCHCLGNKDKMNDLAQYISKRIFVIADESESEEDEYVKISNLIFKYVFDPEFIRKRERDSDNNWIRYYFWEFLLNNLCLKFAYALDMSVYSFFKLNNWYNKSNNISLFVETEANIAVGSLFSYKKANHQFLKFTNDLYDFGDLKDKENCLYIIKHTTPNNSNYLNNANICFDKLLNIIYNNHKLKFDKGSQSWLFNQILRKY